MGNGCNMTPAKCIDCGRLFPRGRMYAGPLCRQCYHKRHPQQAARARQNAHERYLRRKARQQRQMPEEPEIDLDDPTLKKFILDCRTGRHGKEDTSWTSC